MKTEGRNAVIELLKTGKNIDKLLLEKGAQGSISIIFAEARRKMGCLVESPILDMRKTAKENLMLQ